jgi:PD-(D/E)XK nuclease superfamily protein
LEGLEVENMSLQPTASRTELLLACPRPFDPTLESEPDLPGEPARYGSAFHQILAAALRGSAKKPLERSDRYPKEVDRAAAAYDVKGAREELAGHVRSSVKVLRNWLEHEKLEVADIESAYSVRPNADGTWKAGAILPHDDDHRYIVDAGEVPGTVDLIAQSANGKRLVVIDHKTGWEDEGFARPSTIPQMRTLGLVARVFKGSAEVGIFHADRQGLPAMYAEPYEAVEQRAHATELHRALTLIGSGFLRPGAACKRCPARLACPAHAADLLAESTASLVTSANALAVEPIRGPLAPDTGASVEVRAGSLYDLTKKFRALDKAAHEEIKRLVKSGVVIETREGGVLTLRTQSYEVLSKKSVIEALGKVAGERELGKLRKKGAIREATREMLVPEK